MELPAVRAGHALEEDMTIGKREDALAPLAPQFVDLERLMLRAKNALWRSWSIDGLSDAGGQVRDVAESQAESRDKASPKAWELLYKNVLHGGDHGNMRENLRRYRGPAHDGNTMGVLAAQGAGEGPVRGGKLFRHLAGQGVSTQTGLTQGGSDDGNTRGAVRAPWAGPEGCDLSVGLDLSESADFADVPAGFRTRRKSDSVGSAYCCRSAPQGAYGATLPARPSDPTLGGHATEIDSPCGIYAQASRDEARAEECVSVLRKLFIRARNRRLRSLPDDSVSPYLGNELSTHHNIFFAPWLRDGGGGGGVGFRAGAHKQDTDRQEFLEHQLLQRGQPSDHYNRDVTRAASDLGLPVGGAWKVVSHGQSDAAAVTATAAAASAHEEDGATRHTVLDMSSHVARPPVPTAFPDSPVEIAQGPSGFVVGQTMDELEDRTVSGAWSAYGQERGREARPSTEHPTALGTSDGAEPWNPATMGTFGGERRGAVQPWLNREHHGRQAMVKSASALDRLVHEQDRGQPVMLPVVDWKDWTPNRVHWTFPAVVQAFPRLLYHSGDRMGCIGAGATQQGDLQVPWHDGEGTATGEGLTRSSEQTTTATPRQETHSYGNGISDQDGEQCRKSEAESAPPSASLPDTEDPFELHSLGEVLVRTAPTSGLAPAGIGAGLWRRRWLVVRQTYMFELLQAPRGFGREQADEVAARSGGSKSDGEARRKFRRKTKEQVRGQGQERSAERVQARGEEFVAPVGFLCLSKARVEDGSVGWGPPTLVLRCSTRPPEFSREGASGKAGSSGGGDSAEVGRGAGAGTEIVLELRVPSPDIGAVWKELFRKRASLEMLSIFEPAPVDVQGDVGTDVLAGDESRLLVAQNGVDALGDELNTAIESTPLETDMGFPVLGTGRFSKVVRARRRRPGNHLLPDCAGEGPGEGHPVRAVKIVDKQAFWSRARVGKERADALAHEVFCQAVMTCESSHNRYASSCTPGNGNEDWLDTPRHRRRAPVSSRRGEASRCRGGDIVHLHSVVETATELVLEMDLMSRTDLFGRLELTGTFSEPEAAAMIRSLLLAIDACNSCGFCHRDVKLSNLLYPHPVSAHGPECVALADFGMATRAGRDGLVRGRCGTAGYVAPEILKAKKKEGYGINVDVFSAGVVLYVCLCGYEPFYGVDEDQLLLANKAADYEFHLPEWGEVSDGAKDLISSMLEPHPAKRVAPREALAHPWLIKHAERASADISRSVSSGSSA